MKHQSLKTQILPIFMFILSVSPGFTEEKVLVLGAEDQWKSVGFSEGIVFRKGLYGFLDILLSDNEYAMDDETDLLLHFNGNALPEAPVHGMSADGAPAYTLKNDDLQYTEKIAVLGGASAVFSGRRDPLVFVPGEDSVLAPGTIPESFTIEFWLYPITLSEGETPFLFSAERLENGRLLHQEMRCSLEKQKVTWRLDNIFLPQGSLSYAISLRGTKNLIPKTWSHHIIRYDSTTGLIEYYCDGIPQAVTYATQSGRESGNPLYPYIGPEEEPRISIGSGFSGMMDEFRLSSCFREEISENRFSGASGSMTTRVLDLGRTGTRTKMVEATASTPGDTDIGFWIRSSERKTDLLNLDAEWIPFTPGRAIPGEIAGRYIQLRAELYPDGTRERTPVLSEMKIRYEHGLPLMPPARISASPGNGSVTLTWNRPPDDKARGYIVYYGDRPGVYLGTGASIGNSPADIGDTTSIVIGGLKNGTLYYFSVVAYDGSDPPETSVFSPETACRPVTW